MPPKAVMSLRLAISVLALGAGLALLAAACGGGGGQTLAPSGQLTDPRTVPTATPWSQPPEVIPLEAGEETPAAGQESGEGTPMAGECGETYIVQAGDYPGLIAEKCGVSLEDLLEANPGIEPTNLHIGDELNIPQ